jgi:hypothetical protein
LRCLVGQSRRFPIDPSILFVAGGIDFIIVRCAARMPLIHYAGVVRCAAACATQFWLPLLYIIDAAKNVAAGARHIMQVGDASMRFVFTLNETVHSTALLTQLESHFDPLAIGRARAGPKATMSIMSRSGRAVVGVLMVDCAILVPRGCTPRLCRAIA